jgi:hypothetical protein
MHSDWINGIEILQGRRQHGEKVGYCYPSGLEKTLCKWDIYVTLVMKGLNIFRKRVSTAELWWEDNDNIWSFSSSSSIVTTFFPTLSYKEEEEVRKRICEQEVALRDCCLPGYNTVLAVGYVYRRSTEISSPASG